MCDATSGAESEDPAPDGRIAFLRENERAFATEIAPMEVDRNPEVAADLYALAEEFRRLRLKEGTGVRSGGGG